MRDGPKTRLNSSGANKLAQMKMVGRMKREDTVITCQIFLTSYRNI